MGFDIGPRIGIEGEAEYRQHLNQIIQTQKTLASEMAVVASQFDKGERSMSGFNARSVVLTKQIGTQQDRIEELKKGLAAASEKYGEGDIRTLKWKQSLNLATAELNNMTGELKENKRAAMSMAWEKTAAGLKIVGTAAATASAALAAAAIGAAKALAGMTVAGASYADNVLTVSDQTGIATDALQGYMYAAELVDVSTETITKSMAKQIKSMGACADGTKSTVEAYKTLGVEAQNSDGSLRKSQDVYWEVIDALGKMTNETQRDEIAMTLLGKSAQELNPLIKAGSERMRELAAEAEAVGYVMDEKTLSAYGAFDDNLQRLSGSAIAAKNALGTALLPILTQLSGEGVTLLNGFTNAILGCEGDLGAMANIVGEYLERVVEKTADFAPQLIGIAGKLVSGLAGGIVKNLPQILSVGASIVSELILGIAEALPSAGAASGQIAITILSGLLENLPAMTAGAIQLIAALASGIAENVDALVPAAVDAIIGLVSALVENAPLLVSASAQLMIGLAGGLIQSIPSLLSAIPEILASMLIGLTNGLVGFVDIGADIVEGLWEGIQSMGAWISEKVSGFFSGIVAGVKSLLGIHSPSTVFSDEIGKQMAAGVGVGFEHGLNGVAVDMARAQSTLTDNLGRMSAELTISPVVGDGARPTQRVEYEISGTVRHEGVKDGGELISSVDVVMAELVARLRREGRLA